MLKKSRSFHSLFSHNTKNSISKVERHACQRRALLPAKPLTLT